MMWLVAGAVLAGIAEAAFEMWRENREWKKNGG
jgi:hypothetical protein